MTQYFLWHIGDTLNKIIKTVFVLHILIVPVCEHYQIVCLEGTCATQCDGIKQCKNGNDEANCVPKCEHYQIICHDGTCATPCDDIKQCKNGIDEDNCPVKIKGIFKIIIVIIIFIYLANYLDIYV